ncbi:2Fe-2S iron-sulfur cluster-binding protein [Rhodococcus sp. NPDC059968]|uniref:2Fe-2S iron-sulfur cluster-binding protein n=1 Tax=Rhodococcus sp. NPDC059968 TaxID=3347017 RepID=UPI00366DF5C0
MNLPKAYERTEADQTVEVSMTINGSPVTMSLPARITLSDALRDHLGLTGTHVGCEHGICGMCTVLVDGEAARACLLFAVQLDGAEITTVEGLGRPDDLHPLQEAFGHHHGLQCGFCTPGFLMSSYDLLEHQPDVKREDLPAELSGVLCRCTGYRNIIDAVHDVAETYREGIPAPGNCGHRTLVGRSPAGSSGAAGVDDDSVVEPDAEPRPEEIALPSGEPTIQIDVTKDLTASPEDVARVFADVRLLARCLPGAELTDELGDNWYRGRARIALGPVRLSFNGIAHVLDQSADRIAMNAQGKDKGGGGAQAGIVMTASPSAAGTTLRAEASVFLTGRIAGFGRSLAGDVSRRMFEDFARAVDQVASGAEPDGVTSQPPSAVAIVVAALADRARDLMKRTRNRTRKYREAHRRNR